MKEITIDATIDNIDTVTDFINAELEAIDCPMKAQIQFDVAIDELFGNIAHYAYGSDTGEATVRFDYDEDTHTASITFIDRGIPFDPLKKSDPDVTLSLQERKIGGLGIFLVKKSMDDMEYNYLNGQNMLTIKKVLG